MKNFYKLPHRESTVRNDSGVRSLPAGRQVAFTPRNDEYGFTFVELLVVITIIGVIFAAGIVSFSTITSRSRDARRKADLEAIRQSLEICRSLTGSYPADISSNVTCSAGVVLLSVTPTDPKPCGTPAVASYTYSRPTTTTYTLSAPCMENESYQVTNP
ncbi:MAG: fimbrial protein pilin [Candidatus Collierbacteria bacterium GW2011_GWB1_45_35]|uniref:Fimbrial protein pilin n=2 Tax=Candidatus Collieribacteriota TaxID=1752725 RepID=A0A0G1NM20_9BACT|nr:MAG: fimbrial protein pilin [Microgenomates group bacterium GW2011_GWC1_44_23]KKT85264.1 MAG: fimbrial protein pilin [Candidatus Collierbacteria bacterium GW2011_GWA2_44_99]KKT95404.1 MAG: fimbrial protein pilin [Candidatus Collierbacteria bacterium GW2011_GWA1_45_15]KKU00054.1 MAG: fimbrial protein pilin [Candidatus Collierbacteria bacterium GW2011_GWB2_45_17]KKU05153.1 MAG: fimbrial protein pilin [Candidatus Collierbacteria bacterium GW2011_GWB1_45_35]KKU08418.1 MAG: fimbrial protein pili